MHRVADIRQEGVLETSYSKLSRGLDGAVRISHAGTGAYYLEALGRNT